MKRDAFISVVAATLLLALSYGINGRWLEMLAAIALGLIWLLGQARGWEWTVHLGLIGSVSLGAMNIFNGLSAAWSLPGVVAALIAWNFDCFAQQLRAAPRVEGADELRRVHRRRLLIVATIGSLVAVAALLIRVELSFGWTILLALLAVIGLSRTVGALRRASE